METQWKQLLERLKQAGEDFRKETQRMVDDLRDPAKQDKVKESLRDIGTWARGTADEAAKKLEGAVSKLEEAVQMASEKVTERLRPSTTAAAAEAKVPRKKKPAARKTATKKRATTSAAKTRRKKSE